MRYWVPLLSLLACGGPDIKPHPQEIPITEFISSPAAPDEAPAQVASAEVAKADPKSDGKTPVETKAEPKRPDAKDSVDALDSAFGSKWGADPKSAGKAKSIEKVGDRQVLQALDRRKDFGIAVSPVLGYFKERLGTVGFRVKVVKDCKALRGAIEKRFGAPTDSAKSKAGESVVWKGDAIGLRLASDPKGCSGVAVQKEFSREQDWSSIEP